MGDLSSRLHGPDIAARIGTTAGSSADGWVWWLSASQISSNFAKVRLT